jgi:hypothetical protein
MKLPPEGQGQKEANPEYNMGNIAFCFRYSAHGSTPKKPAGSEHNPLPNVSNEWWSQAVVATLYLMRGEVMRWRRDDGGACSLRRTLHERLFAFRRFTDALSGPFELIGKKRLSAWRSWSLE